MVCWIRNYNSEQNLIKPNWGLKLYHSWISGGRGGEALPNKYMYDTVISSPDLVLAFRGQKKQRRGGGEGRG